jgi:hypothetical protein
LTNRLSQRSLLTRILHEPFNLPRVYGNITKHWIEKKDYKVLNKSNKAICSLRKCIKHCVEMVPFEISQSLATAACESSADYKHLFLLRKDSVSRLLSLEYAKGTGVWGAAGKKKVKSDENAFLEPLPINALIEHEKKCSAVLTKIWHLISSLGQTPIVLTYEEIYQSDHNSAYKKLENILNELNLSYGEQEDYSFISEVIGKGYQGTKNKYQYFDGIDSLRNEISKLNLFHDISSEVSGCYRSLIWSHLGVTLMEPPDGHHNEST